MVWFFFFLSASAELVLWSPGYEADERSLLGLNGLALPVADAARPFSCAAVCVQRSRAVGKAHTGHRKRVDTQNQSLKMPVTKTKSSPASATISSVHNGLKLWTLDFYVLMYEQAVYLLNFYALLVTYSTATPLRVSAV